MSEPGSPSVYGKVATIVVAIVATAAASGYFMGLLQTANYSERVREETRRATEPGNAPEPDHPEAPTYAELAKSNIGPNAGWKNAIANLPHPTPSLPGFKPPPDKTSALATRATRRAYDGAPPVIPHQIDQISAASCLACHGKPLKIGVLISPVMSHEARASCTQCHAPTQMPPQLSTPGATFADIRNRFEGRVAPQQGTKLFPNSPPTIPHTTFMRNDCLSCHGIASAPALRTTHPERQSCLQCHAPNAEREFRVFLSEITQ